ncbi:MAG: helix-turn-helix domain-containing protein [Proteobacteria bacterium]|nr:helix-turn-helix domain-containing protein [Pseudomonadota bacterium]
MKPQIAGDAVTVRFFLPSPALAPFVSAYYLTEVNVPAGTVVEDFLHPEWGNVRFARNESWQAAVGQQPLRPAPQLIASGPSSYSSHFVTGTARMWGVGILPLGWARFFDLAASDLADDFCDAAATPAFTGLAGLPDATFGNAPDPAAEAARIDAFMLAYLAARPPHPDEDRIRAAHAALIDRDIASVADLAGRLATSPRSLERLSLRAFGFSPKLLLRRQRFLRSLAQFMLDPSLRWISTLDWQYVDQAHFVRDFKRFMGMSPSAYGALDHPVLRAAARARAATVGEAVQALHHPQ